MAARIDLESGCLPTCEPLIVRTYEQLNTETYSLGASILAVTAFETWRAGHRTARKRADRASRLGYQFDKDCDWSRHADDIYAINTSLAERQGRPMSASYLEYRDRSAIPEQPCGRHRVHTYGVLQDDTLHAYLSLYRVGELAHVSMLLGHGDHLRNDVMYLLMAGVIEHQAAQGGWMFYNAWSSGTDGLRYFKTKLGFASTDIEWEL